MNCRTEIICLLLAVVWAAVNLSAASLAELPVGSVIACEGSYGDHIQGMATDGEAIYWSFASTLVKTDLNGKVSRSHTIAAIRAGRTGRSMSRTAAARGTGRSGMRSHAISSAFTMRSLS